MRANRGRDTGPEIALRRALRQAGLLGYRVNVANLPGRPDIVFTRHKLAVFVHGCFWHRCPMCNPPAPKRHRSFWMKKFEANRVRDARQEVELDFLGWRVLQFWECEVKSSVERCVMSVRRSLAIAAEEEVDVESTLIVAEQPTHVAREGVSARRQTAGRKRLRR